MNGYFVALLPSFGHLKHNYVIMSTQLVGLNLYTLELVQVF